MPLFSAIWSHCKFKALVGATPTATTFRAGLDRSARRLPGEGRPTASCYNCLRTGQFGQFPRETRRRCSTAAVCLNEVQIEQPHAVRPFPSVASRTPCATPSCNSSSAETEVRTHARSVRCRGRGARGRRRCNVGSRTCPLNLQRKISLLEALRAYPKFFPSHTYARSQNFVLPLRPRQRRPARLSDPTCPRRHR
jgi:hypothetical protein